MTPGIRKSLDGRPWNGAWVAAALGVTLAERDPDPVLPLSGLVGLALRRNPRRAHLLVSSALGKHVPTDPRIVYAAGRLLGARVGALLAGPRNADATSTDATLTDATLADATLADATSTDAASTGAALLAAALAGDDAATAQLALTSTTSTASTGAVPDAVVLGFAETATALGHCVAQSLTCRYIHSTRRTSTGVAAVATFAEEHSHAVDHLVLAEDERFLAGAGPLVLVDDELSTGRTARNTIRALHERWPHPRYVVATLIDLRTDDDRARSAALAAELGVPIDVVALATGSIELPPELPTAAATLVASIPADPPSTRSHGLIERMPSGWPDGTATGARFGLSSAETQQLQNAAAEVARALAATLAAGAVLVLGTEELMFAPLCLATALARLRTGPVRFSTTTRSPAVAVDDAGYALRTALTFPDPELGVGARFAYNVAGREWTTIVVVVDDPMDTAALAADDGLLYQLARCAPHVVVLTLPERTERAPSCGPAVRGSEAAGPSMTMTAAAAAAAAAATAALPPALRGPDFGSYARADVGWLLTDLSAAHLEAPTEEREEAIQAGAAHYAESLPIEYQPSAAYQTLFHAALEESAARVALAVGVVTEMVLAERGPDVVLASLARAGTPIGILMRRWAQFAHRIDLPHYALSIVRGRGIDELALTWLAAHHEPSSIAFVDGWTGKGAIVRELTTAVEKFNAVSSLTPYRCDIAVLADPGSCVSLFGTRDDFLVPSACLNSTVSGLVSRTVLNDALIGPGQFHGAKFYAELAAVDESRTFLDRVTESFPSVAEQVSSGWKPLHDNDRRPTWSGWAAVEAISERYGIGDVNLVKPGVGETTRVLLRRVPWRILLRPDARAELAHVELLAAQRGVEIEEVPGLAYSCVGLIHPRFSRAATGADKRRAAG